MGGKEGSRVDFFRAKEITQYLYANENDPVWGGRGDGPSNIYAKLCFALEAQRTGGFCFLLCAFPYFPNYLT